jgi:hypothetical protein
MTDPEILQKILIWLKDPHLNHCVYMENGEDKDALVKEIEEYLKEKQLPH